MSARPRLEAVNGYCGLISEQKHAFSCTWLIGCTSGLDPGQHFCKLKEICNIRNTQECVGINTGGGPGERDVKGQYEVVRRFCYSAR